MTNKPRLVSEELKILRSLNDRMILSEKEANHLWYLEKGYAGEQMFDEWSEKLSNNCLILNDLLLEFSTNTFQIDSLLISEGTIYLFEVKNYEGDYIVEKERWYSTSNNEIKNPLPQLERSEALLRRYLHGLGYTFTIEPYLIFINPNFTLYQAPFNKSIIFPTQLNSFLTKINAKISSAKPNGRHAKIAQLLIDAHQTKSRYTHIPDYSYEELKKGITCARCHKFIANFKGKGLFLVCICGSIENTQSAILRSVAEFNLLFPDRKITTKVIMEWCGIFKCPKTIQKILSKNFKRVDHGKSSYYVK